MFANSRAAYGSASLEQVCPFCFHSISEASCQKEWTVRLFRAAWAPASLIAMYKALLVSRCCLVSTTPLIYDLGPQSLSVPNKSLVLGMFSGLQLLATTIILIVVPNRHRISILNEKRPGPN